MSAENRGPAPMELLRNLPYFLLTLALSITGQGLTKLGIRSVLAETKPSVAEFIRRLPAVLTEPRVVVGTLISGLGLLCYMFLLSRYDLGRVVPILGGLAYILLFLVGRLALAERTNWVNFVGILVIIVGLYLVSVVD